MTRLRRSAAVVALCSLGIAAAVAVASPAAGADTVPAPWEPVSSAEAGTLALYDASGAQVFSGSTTDTPIAAYAVGSATTRSGDTEALLELCTPSASQQPAAWPCIDLAPSSFPLTSGPSSVQTSSQTEPTFTGLSSDGSLQSTVLTKAPNTSTADGYAGVYQLRLVTENAADAPSPTYDAADIQVDPDQGTFQLVYGTGVASAPGSGIAVSSPSGTVEVMTPADGVLSGVTDTPPADLPTPLPPEVSAPDGAIGYTVSDVPDGSSVSVTIHLTFHPTAYLFLDASGALYNAGSMAQINGDLVTLTITDGGLGDDSSATGGVITDPGMPVMTPPPYVGTQFTASNGDVTLGDQDTFTATVFFLQGSCPTTGTVTFFDLGDPTMTGQTTRQIFQAPASTFQQGAGNGIPGTVGCTVFTSTAALTLGLNLVEAEWTPAGFVTGFSGGSVLVDVTAPTACEQTGSSCTDQQNVEGGIPVGTITITTPYNGSGGGCTGSQPAGAAAPVTITPGTAPNENSLTASTPGCVDGVLNIGTLALTSNDSMLTAHTTFQDISVTDHLSANQPWTVTAQSSDLTDGGRNALSSFIDSQDVGLTAVTENLTDEGSNHYTGTVTAASNPAAPAVAPGTSLGAAGQQGLGLSPHTVLTATTGLGTYTADGTITLNAPTTTEAGLFTGTITFTVATI